MAAQESRRRRAWPTGITCVRSSTGILPLARSMTTRARLLVAITAAIATLATMAIPAEAAKLRTCFYYSNSGWGLWATRNVSCKTARRVYRDATRQCNGMCDTVRRVDGYRCKLSFDGGGDGSCTASRNRRIRFSVP
jgi:hypothetical protein